MNITKRRLLSTMELDSTVLIYQFFFESNDYDSRFNVLMNMTDDEIWYVINIPAGSNFTFPIIGAKGSLRLLKAIINKKPDYLGYVSIVTKAVDFNRFNIIKYLMTLNDKDIHNALKEVFIYAIRMGNIAIVKLYLNNSKFVIDDIESFYNSELGFDTYAGGSPDIPEHGEDIKSTSIKYILDNVLKIDRPDIHAEMMFLLLEDNRITSHLSKQQIQKYISKLEKGG